MHDLIIVGAVRKHCAFLDEIIYPARCVDEAGRHFPGSINGGSRRARPCRLRVHRENGNDPCASV